MRYSRDFTGSPHMDQLVVSLLIKIQKGLCAVSKKPLKDFQLHHKRYGMDITIKDLDLRNKEYHKHGKKGMSGVGRNIYK